MHESRARYRQALADAGPNFVANNPGQHFFYTDGPEELGQVCVFCGTTSATQDEDPSLCPGDLRRAGVE